MALQTPRPFSIDPEILDTSTAPADRFCYTARFVGYLAPDVDPEIQLPPYRGGYVGRLGAQMPAEVRRDILERYPGILKYADQLAAILRSAPAPNAHGAETLAAQTERDAKSLLDLLHRHVEPSDRAAIVAAANRVADSGRRFLALGPSSSGGQGQVGHVTIPGGVSPEQQLAISLGTEIGFLYLDRTRIRPIGFSVGEFLYSLSLAPGEEVTIEQKTYSKRESTFEDLNDQESTLDMEISSNLTSELTEGLNQENSRLARDSETGGVHVGVVYEGVSVQAGPTTTDSVDDGSKLTMTDSLKNSRTSSSKVAAKYRAQHKTTFTVSTENRFETSSKRVIRNPNPFTPIDLLYFKVNQKLRLSHERFGVRLCWAPAIRNPAAPYYLRLQALKDQIYAAAATASAGPRPVPPTPPATQNSTTTASAVTIADKFDWFNGSQRHDYLVSILPPSGAYVWDGDPNFVKSSLMFSFSGSRPNHAEVTSVGNDGNGMSCIVHVGIEDNLWIDYSQTPPALRYEGTGTASFTVFANFISSNVAGNSDYNQQLAQWQSADAQWQAEDAQAKADALAKADAAWADLRGQQLADLNPLNETFAVLIAQMFPSQFRDDITEIDRWEQFFDWSNASLKLYPSWWTASPPREPTLPATHFVNASWARLFLPVRVGLEDQALRWIYQLTAQAPLFTGTNDFITEIVTQLNDYREANFGSAGEVVVTGSNDGSCPDTSEPFLCLGQWEESLPTDGTHLEVLQATSIAADDDSRQRLADAAALRAAEIERLQADNAIRAAVKDSGPGTVHTEIRLKLGEHPQEDDATKSQA